MLISTLISCKPDLEEISNVPYIALESIEQLKNVDDKDSAILVTLYYEDGDGDIGLSETDTSAPFNFGSPFYHNLPVTYLVENSNGVYEELQNPNNNEPYGNQHERIPNLTPAGKFKTIKGTITISLTANPVLAKPNKIKLEMKLMDRALNVSNAVSSSDIILEH